jgi:hypothetical protein
LPLKKGRSVREKRLCDPSSMSSLENLFPLHFGRGWRVVTTCGVWVKTETPVRQWKNVALCLCHHAWLLVKLIGTWKEMLLVLFPRIATNLPALASLMLRILLLLLEPMNLQFVEAMVLLVQEGIHMSLLGLGLVVTRMLLPVVQTGVLLLAVSASVKIVKSVVIVGNLNVAALGLIQIMSSSSTSGNCRI